MPEKRFPLAVAAACLLAGGARAELVTVRIAPDTTTPGKLTITGDGDKQAWKIEADLSGLPKGARIYRAYLFAKRSQPLTGRQDWALTNIHITPSGPAPAGVLAPLKLVGPWYDRFDATDTVRKIVKSPGAWKGFSIDAFPKLDARSIYLHIEYEGKVKDPPKQPAGLRVLHQAGQTFITWTEVDRRIKDEQVAWGVLKEALAERDAKRVVRYRVYRHTAAITARNIHQAECLAEVKPLSGYNVLGRSADQAFHVMRKRMLVDMDYAKSVSRRWYSIPASAHNEVVIDRFVIPGWTTPLPGGTGLYVHHPTKAGKAYYAVTAAVNGRENTAALKKGQNVVGPVAEKPGTGKPVLQRQMNMKILFDYAGRRLQYTQWTSPPLSNLPGQYYNWSVFIPEGVKEGAPLEIVLSGNDMFRRPRWPHRLDTILVSPHDRHGGGSLAGKPIQTWYFGYHESAGTLRSFKQGTIQPYTWRRMLAFLDWAFEEFKIDRSRVTCSGDRGYSATAALHFGMRHPKVFSVVYTCKGMPNPGALPLTRKRYGRTLRTATADLQKLIGRKEWGLRIDTDHDAWKFFDLGAEVAANPKVVRPMLSYGGRGHWEWPPIAKFLRALTEARQPVISEGTWGAVNPPGLKNPGRGVSGLDVRLDRPIPVFTAHSSDYQGGRNGDGGQTNYGVWWEDDSIVDAPEKFEIVITGGGTVNVTPRRLKKFVLKPGEKVTYKTELLGKRLRRQDKPQSGEAIADGNGLVTIPKVNIRGRARLIITRSGS